MTARNDELGVLDRLPAVDLSELERLASLQTRVDRKYLLPAHRSTELLCAVSREVAVLRIDGASSFRYDTVYFDTPSLDSYLGAAHRRRHRFKVRVRRYVDSGSAVLEVKRKGRRGETVKVRTPHLEPDAILTPEASTFIEDTLGRSGLAERLRPVLTTSFVRTTLLDRRDGSRATLDREVSLGLPGGEAVVLDERSILETKSVGAATEADRWLWAHRHRPASFSKFCIGMALHHGELPANKWNRILRRDLGWRPQRTGSTGAAAADPIDDGRLAVPVLTGG
jgi:hypothetical protein